MEVVWKLPPELQQRFNSMEQEAYSQLVIGNYIKAELIYNQQYEIFKKEEEKLPKNKKYHKGGPLHNKGIALLLQKKILTGFQLITLAYIEDLLNHEKIESVYNSPAYKTLNSYKLIPNNFLENIRNFTQKRKDKNQVPRDPQEIIQDYIQSGQTNLQSLLTTEATQKNPITIEQISPLIQEQLKALGPKEKRVFVGGSYRNIVLLRHIKEIVENIDDFKAIIPIDMPKLSGEIYEHLIHEYDDS